MEKGYSNNLSDGEWGGKAERPAFSIQRMHVVNSAGEENSSPRAPETSSRREIGDGAAEGWLFRG